LRASSTEQINTFVDVRQSQELFYKKEQPPAKKQQKEVQQVKLLQN
jgi:hypothetical protein